MIRPPAAPALPPLAQGYRPYGPRFGRRRQEAGKAGERYFAPETEVLELKLEGVIAASGGDVTPNNPFSGWPEDTWS